MTLKGSINDMFFDLRKMRINKIVKYANIQRLLEDNGV